MLSCLPSDSRCANPSPVYGQFQEACQALVDQAKTPEELVTALREGKPAQPAVNEKPVKKEEIPIKAEFPGLAVNVPT